jgi:hypothetical protein
VVAGTIFQNVATPRLTPGEEAALNQGLVVLVSKLRALSALPILNGQEISWRTVDSPTELRHTLRRRPSGLIVMRRPPGVDVGVANYESWTDQRVFVEADVSGYDVALFVW